MPKPTDGAAGFEYHKSQLISGLNKIGEDIQQLHSAFQGFTQFIASASYSPDGQVSFAGTPGKPGRKRKFKDEDGRKARKVKDPNAPRRPASSYILFQNDMRPKLRVMFPDFSHNELMAHVAKIWAEMPPEKKQTYERQHADAKVIYEEKKVQYENSKNGIESPPIDAVIADGSSDVESGSPTTTKKDVDSEDDDAEEEVEEEDEDAEEDLEEEEAAPPKKKSKSEEGAREKEKKHKPA